MRRASAFWFLWLLAACTLPSVPSASPPPPSITAAASTPAPLPSTTSPPPTRQVPSPTPLPQAAPDTAALQNAWVTLPDTGLVQLREGRFSQGEIRLSLDTAAVSGESAAAVVSVNLGGSGNFAYLLFFEAEGGTWVQRGEAYFIEDRPIIHGLRLEEGRVVLEATLHWYDEPFCCPTKRARLTFFPGEGGLRLQRLSTFTAGGTEYSLTLLSVENIEGGERAVRVFGRVSVTPFEGALVYRYTSVDGREVLERGGIMVTPDNPEVMGSPGTFEAELPLPPLPSEEGFQLQVLDLSPRDGSPVAMDSVWLENGR